MTTGRVPMIKPGYGVRNKLTGEVGVVMTDEYEVCTPSEVLVKYEGEKLPERVHYLELEIV
ncbi:hypothetical protein EPO05_04315 [Patescibacteria group bacterium]|nr:MAG: hypothetical protein EPO05_04315 [Patescibacteria group bacterium]